MGIRPTQTDKITGGDLVVLYRYKDSGYLAAPIESIVSVLDSSVHGEGVAPGGSVGNILSKGSSTDFDTAWRDYLTNVRSVAFNTAAGETSAVGKLYWDDANGTLGLGLKGGGVTLQLGQELNQLVKHADNTGLLDGKVVYVVGATGDNLTVRYAQANSEITSATTIGVMTETATGGNKGFMTTYGLVHDIDTSALTEGAVVWLSPSVAGGMTTTKPTAPDHTVMVGICVRQHAVNGHLFVMPNNGYELSELHDVLITAPVNAQVLTYQSGLWVNRGGLTTASGSGNITAPGTVIYTGTSNATLTLYSPSASNVGDVVKVKHDGAGALTLNIGRPLILTPGDAVELCVISSTEWGIF